MKIFNVFHKAWKQLLCDYHLFTDDMIYLKPVLVLAFTALVVLVILGVLRLAQWLAGIEFVSRWK